MQTITEKTESIEPNDESVIEEGNNSIESGQKTQSVDEILTEIIHTNKITDDAQTEQIPEETVDAEDTTGEEKNEVEESPVHETDTSSAQNDVAAESNVADAAETITTTAKKGEETEISKIFEALHKITLSQGDVTGEPITGKIFEAIQKMTQSRADLPGQPVTEDNPTPNITSGLLEISANEIMQNHVTWASPEDSVQQAVTKMQQTDAGYIMVGQDGKLEGIVSKSDIAKATSPFLLPIFAKWRRPLDDATRKIRIKWIMSRPAHTIKPQTPLAAIVEHMSRLHVRCLPVLDEEGNVHGLVTAFDIFEALLKPAEPAKSENQESSQ